MSCVLCNSEDARTTRYGHQWCDGCLPQLQFEERLARARHVEIRQVIRSATGDVHMVFDTCGRLLSRNELRALLPTHDDALEEFIAAVRSLRNGVALSAFGRVVFASAEARVAAQRLLDLLEQFGSLLNPELMRETVKWQRVAAQVVRPEVAMEHKQ